jgi:hypothetical protein
MPASLHWRRKILVHEAHDLALLGVAHAVDEGHAVVAHVHLGVEAATARGERETVRTTATVPLVV